MHKATELRMQVQPPCHLDCAIVGLRLIPSASVPAGICPLTSRGLLAWSVVVIIIIIKRRNKSHTSQAPTVKDRD